MKRYISYYRVSTQRQGQSGLGLEAQMATVREFVNGHGELAAEYTEIETGKRADRPQLLTAIAHARRARATLVIAKLDRLARNVAFTATLMESGADFLACDMPEANKLTIHILAAVAEDEARRISARTKDALAAYKARGGKLGAARPECREISREAGKRGSVVGARRVAQQARVAYLDILPVMTRLRNAAASLREIARYLNETGHVTRQGQFWNATHRYNESLNAARRPIGTGESVSDCSLATRTSPHLLPGVFNAAAHAVCVNDTQGVCETKHRRTAPRRDYGVPV